MLKAFAKVNLTLDIVGKRGHYHTLRSIVTFINLFDVLDISFKEGPIVFSPPIDTTHSTLHMVRDLTGIVFSAMVRKNIPPTYGLGGGSSDAAATLGLMMTLGLIDRKRALEVAQEVGADVPLFLHKPAPLLMEGIGEKVKPVDMEIPQKFYLLLPPVGASTPEVYRTFDLHPIHTDYTAQSIALGQVVMGNALSRAFTELTGIQIPKGCHITGSGSGIICTDIPTRIPDNWRIIPVSTVKKGWVICRG